MSAADLDHVFPFVCLGCDQGIIGRLRHVNVIVGMDRCLTSNRCACELATPVGDDLVHVHVELRPAASHPDVQRKHVVVLARENLIAGLDNESEALVIEALPGMIGDGRAFLQCGVSGDHLSWDQMESYAEMLQRTLGLRAPQLIRWDFH